MNSNVQSMVVEVLSENGVFLQDCDAEHILEIDSLTYITIVVDLEKKFDIEFDDSDLILEDVTILKLVQIVEEKMRSLALNN